MEIEEKKFLRLINEIENIKSKKLDEWLAKAKKYLPSYVAEYLFMKKLGVVSQMIYAENETGLVYDPIVLRQGIDILMNIMESQNLGHDNARLKAMYTNFADASTRVGYLKPIVDQLDIYPTLKDEIISDVKKVMAEAQSAEEIEFFETYIKNIEAREKIQSKELAEKLARQKQ